MAGSGIAAEPSEEAPPAVNVVGATPPKTSAPKVIKVSPGQTIANANPANEGMAVCRHDRVASELRVEPAFSEFVYALASMRSDVPSGILNRKKP